MPFLLLMYIGVSSIVAFFTMRWVVLPFVAGYTPKRLPGKSKEVRCRIVFLSMLSNHCLAYNYPSTFNII